MFKEVNQGQDNFTIKQQCLIKKKGEKEIWIYDSGNSYPYLFQCACELSKTQIEIPSTPNIKFQSVYTEKVRIASKELIDNGGSGTYYKYLQCDKCDTIYFIGLGLTEPNNGRNVFVVHTIFEVERI